MEQDWRHFGAMYRVNKVLGRECFIIIIEEPQFVIFLFLFNVSRKWELNLFSRFSFKV